MRAWRSFLILSLFFIDVRVRAENSPGDCWGKRIPCAISAGEARRELRAGDFTLVLERGALVEQRDADLLQLVAGVFYLESKVPLKFNTAYASFSCGKECKALAERDSDGLTLKSLHGEWIIRRIGDDQEYALKSGLQVRVSEVQTDGLAHMEFPQSLPWDATVKQWGKFFPGTKQAFKPELKRFREEWRTAVELASLVHQHAASRTLASHEDQLAKERARRKATEKEEQELRSLFRQKNYIDP